MDKVLYALIAAILGYTILKPKNNAVPSLPSAPVTPTVPTESNPSPVPGFSGYIYNVIDSLKKHPTKTYGSRLPGNITGIIMHHSGTTGGSAESYARYHVDNKGWPGIGYHFVVSKDGTIKQTNHLQTISYHVSGHNARNIGICCIGHYDYEVMPQAQLDSAAWLVNNLRGQLGFLPIEYHKNVGNKTCPGLMFPYQQFENRVQQLA